MSSFSSTPGSRLSFYFMPRLSRRNFVIFSLLRPLYICDRRIFSLQPVLNVLEFKN